MQPEPIPTEPFDLGQLRKPLDQDYTSVWVKGSERKFAICDISVDLEGCGGRQQALNGTCSIGFAAFCRANHEMLFAHEWAVNPLAGRDDRKQLDWWMADETRRASWARIQEARRPRRVVAEEIRQLLNELNSLGWTPHLLMRPVGYDFRELTGFFQTLGVEILAERLVLGLSANEILDQACCAYDRRHAAPQHYDDLNAMESPFGFGGAGQVTDIGQQIIAWIKLIWPEPKTAPDFNTLLGKLVGRQLIHSGKQDAIDQYKVWARMSLLANTVQAALMDHNWLKYQETVSEFMALVN